MPPPFDQAFGRGFSGVLALFSAGRLAEAEEAAVALTAAHPGDAPAFNILGVIQASLGKAEAAAQFRQAMALTPTWDEPYANLGLLLCHQKDFAAAAETFRTALKLKPENPAAALNLGNALRELGAREEAAAHYRAALTAPGPHEALAHNNLGAILLDFGQAADAAACFHRAMALQPALADAHLNLGRALGQLGQFDAALENLDRAAALSPQSGETAVMRGNILRDLGRREDAAQAYRRALDLKPGDGEAAYNLGLVLNDFGRHREGLEVIAGGPGIVTLSVTPRPDTAVPRRAELGLDSTPTFIGSWFLDKPAVCDQIIAFFESRAAEHVPGRSARGLDAAVKNSTDLTVLPRDLDKPAFTPVADYLRQLEACIADYARQWPVFAGMLSQVDLGPFTIQRYREGGHFQRVHSERMSFGYIHRVLAWMTYLNDVDAGGETTFHHYGLAVRPERGKTLIWPAEWTHAHAGGVVKAGSKYIITGWMHFPHPSP